MRDNMNERFELFYSLKYNIDPVENNPTFKIDDDGKYHLYTVQARFEGYAGAYQEMSQ